MGAQVRPQGHQHLGPTGDLMGFAFFKHDTKFDFIGKRRFFYALAVLLCLVGLGNILFGSGLKMGIDFAGGVIMQVEF